MRELDRDIYISLSSLFCGLVSVWFGCVLLSSQSDSHLTSLSYQFSSSSFLLSGHQRKKTIASVGELRNSVLALNMRSQGTKRHC